MEDVLIIGGGIGGLTLALMLGRAGMPCRVFEAAPEVKPLGVGINLLPHAMKELTALGLDAPLARLGVLTTEAAFFNRFGQLIYQEPLGRPAGYRWPQISIHRGDLHRVLLDAFVAEAGAERLHLGWQCVRADEDGTAHFRRTEGGAALPPQQGRSIVGADGIHSAIRKQLYPEEGEPLYSGVNMWRGVTRWPPILGGATMIRCGWFTHAKIVIYPIRRDIDAAGRQLVNWVVEIETPKYQRWNWARAGRLEDFIGPMLNWHFDWLDVPEFLRQADVALEYPMVDKDPLPRWSFGRITLLGDAAHPMYPRGSNGAGQAILDARALARCLAAEADPLAALCRYEALRREATAQVVRTNRATPPDVILGEVHKRTGDKPFRSIDDVISRDELVAITDAYKHVAGYTREKLAE
jgi:2-polyprenyl-6-methoxyphenol hydroxylase-like FAD-dependent oxidoreductase